MLKFKFFIEQYLKETTLAGSGLQGLRHAQKYVIPGNDLTLKTKHKDIGAGSTVNVISHHTDDRGRVHAKVTHNGQEKTIPISKFNKPVGKGATKYNDEHATVKMWNHANKDGSHKDINKLHADIESAKKDPHHPLSFENADSKGFEGGKKNDSAKEDYYRKLHKTALSVTAMANSDDKVIQHHVKKRSIAHVQGGEYGKLSSIYRKHYGEKVKGTPGTSKADIRLGEKGEKGAGFISVKDETGGQISSGGAKELGALHHAAASEMLNHHPEYRHLSDAEKDAHHKRIMSHVTKMQHIMHDDTKQTDEKMKSRIGQASKIHDKMHHEYPNLWHEVRREAMTGRQKFEQNEDGSTSSNVATHIIRHPKIGKKGNILKPAEVTNIDDIDHGSKRKGVFAKGKTGVGGHLSYRIAG